MQGNSTVNKTNTSICIPLPNKSKAADREGGTIIIFNAPHNEDTPEDHSGKNSE